MSGLIRNIVDGEADHARASQQRYFDYMRSKNRYEIPVADGVDPAGWTAGLRRYVDDRYRLTASKSFDAALRASVRNLRRTNLPVGITVAHGNRALVLHWLRRDSRSGGDDRLRGDERPRRRPAVGSPEPDVRLRHAPEYRANAEAAPGLLHPMALPEGADGLGGSLGLDPAGAGQGGGRGPDGVAFADRDPGAHRDPEPDADTRVRRVAVGRGARREQPATRRFSRGPTKESAIDDVRSTGAPVGAMLLIVALLVVVVGGLGLRARRH